MYMYYIIHYRHLTDFAKLGLRTLCFGKRELKVEEALAWLEKFNAAKASLDNRDKQLSDCAEALEVDLKVMPSQIIRK